MRTGYSLLYRRQGIYRFRRIVPKDVREIMGRREVKISLLTTDTDSSEAKSGARGDQGGPEDREGWRGHPRYGATDCLTTSLAMVVEARSRRRRFRSPSARSPRTRCGSGGSCRLAVQA
jgi:hypothetical protein